MQVKETFILLKKQNNSNKDTKNLKSSESSIWYIY